MVSATMPPSTSNRLTSSARIPPYFDTILDNGAQYQYGEVLQGDAGLNAAAYPALFEKYSSNGGALRSALNSKNLNAGNLSNLQGGRECRTTSSSPGSSRMTPTQMAIGSPPA